MESKTEQQIIANTIQEKREETKPTEPPLSARHLSRKFRFSRSLTDREIHYVREIYGNSIDYSKVRITRDHWFSIGSPHVIGNTIHFTSMWFDNWLFYDTPNYDLSKDGLDLLGHEIGHVWQFQNGGYAYIGDALTQQFLGFLRSGTRDAAYNYQIPIEAGLPFKKWNPEQQAEAIDEYNLAKRYGDYSYNTDYYAEDIIKHVEPYLDIVRRGEGAVQISIPGVLVTAATGYGIGWLIKRNKGASIGGIIGVLLNFPWNNWFKKPIKSYSGGITEYGKNS